MQEIPGTITVYIAIAIGLLLLYLLIRYLNRKK